MPVLRSAVAELLRANFAMQKDIYCPSTSSELNEITCLASLAHDHEMPVLRSAVAELRRANFAMQKVYIALRQAQDTIRLSNEFGLS